jgi:integrase
MADMHRFQKGYQTCLTRLWKSDLRIEDKEGVEQFLRDSRAKGTGYARLIKLSQVLTMLGKRINKPFCKAREEDLKRLVHYYEANDYSFWTRHDVKVILKQFYAWLNKGVYPKKVEWICTTIPLKEKRLVNHKELLTVDEITKLIDACDHPRNKALIAILAESGARVGEIGNLTIGQVCIDPNGVVLNLEGKTGSRRIRLVSSTPHLVTWLNNHPDRENSSALVWINYGPRGYHCPMSYEAVRKIVQLTFQRAGIKKRAHPYIFRHTRACQLAHHLTEFQMNAYFGWVQGSEMPATYVHISGKDLDEHILRINGMKPGETPVYSKPQDRICPRCKTVNAPTALYCCKCAEIVDPALALKTQMQETEKPVKRVKTPFLEWLQNDPEMRDILKKKVVEFRAQPS